MKSKCFNKYRQLNQLLPGMTKLTSQSVNESLLLSLNSLMETNIERGRRFCIIISRIKSTI